MMCFKCGGIMLVFNWVYVVVDGFFGFYFMKFWVEFGRGEEVLLFFVYDCVFVKVRKFFIFLDLFFEYYSLEFLNISGYDLL